MRRNVLRPSTSCGCLGTHSDAGMSSPTPSLVISYTFCLIPAQMGTRTWEDACYRPFVRCGTHSRRRYVPRSLFLCFLLSYFPLEARKHNLNIGPSAPI